MDGMTTYYNHFSVPQMYDFPVMFTEWSPIVPNIYTPPLVPVNVISPQIITPVLCPYTGVLVTESVVPVIPTVAVDVTPVICNSLYSHNLYEPEYDCIEKCEFIEALSDEVQYTEEDVSDQVEVEEEIDKTANREQYVNPIELYLRLPRELFPTARMISIDPNAIIDEFCKIASIRENVSWILDLEFGVPRVPVTRAIATYDVKFNSVHCKNTPGAIHPGFEKCSSDFKRIILFYYDCIVSNWYNGYVVLNYDKSVENFQSWLQIPMQIFGMCWP